MQFGVNKVRSGTGIILQTDRHRQSDGQTDRQTGRRTPRQIKLQRERHT